MNIFLCSLKIVSNQSDPHCSTTCSLLTASGTQTKRINYFGSAQAPYFGQCVPPTLRELCRSHTISPPVSDPVISPTTRTKTPSLNAAHVRVENTASGTDTEYAAVQYTNKQSERCEKGSRRRVPNTTTICYTHSSHNYIAGAQQSNWLLGVSGACTGVLRWHETRNEYTRALCQRPPRIHCSTLTACEFLQVYKSIGASLVGKWVERGWLALLIFSE